MNKRGCDINLLREISEAVIILEPWLVFLSFCAQGVFFFMLFKKRLKRDGRALDFQSALFQRATTWIEKEDKKVSKNEKQKETLPVSSKPDSKKVTVGHVIKRLKGQ